ncbi:MAG: PRC-barrel domain-containing protein [Devosia sp.]
MPPSATAGQPESGPLGRVADAAKLGAGDTSPQGIEGQTETIAGQAMARAPSIIHWADADGAKGVGRIRSGIEIGRCLNSERGRQPIVKGCPRKTERSPDETTHFEPPSTAQRETKTMLWNASAINNYAVEATDGPIGTVTDFLFDDKHWTVRWLVVDTGRWLTGRKVILPPSALGRPDPAKGTFSVKLTQQQVEGSPGIGPDEPVSAEHEAGALEHYGLSPYWSAGYLDSYRAQWGSTPFPESGGEEQSRRIADAEHDRYNPALRSFALLHGYHIESRDGDIGHVEDFLIDDTDWGVRFLVIDTRNWWPGKRVLISPKSVLEIDWQARMVTLNADRQKVKDSPAYDPSAIIDGAFVEQFHRHYGLPTGDGTPIA